MAWTTKSSIRGNHWVPLGCRALLSSVKTYVSANNYFVRVLSLHLNKGKFVKLTEQFDWFIFKSKTIQKMCENYIHFFDLQFLPFWNNTYHYWLLLVYFPQIWSCDVFTSFDLWDSFHSGFDVVYWTHCCYCYNFHRYMWTFDIMD